MKFVEIVKNTNIDFIGVYKKSFIFSAIIVLLGLLGFVMIWLNKANMSVDFTGGTQVQIEFSEQVKTADLRKALTDGGIDDVYIQEVTGTRGFLVKTKLVDTEKEKIEDKISAILKSDLKGKNLQILGSNMVGATLGKTLKRNAVIAVVISLVCIVIYIAWRFNFIFGLAATIATFHDVLAMLGLFYIFGREMNILFITALLTVAGYSLSDTVVVFDRVRENMVKMKSKADLADIINRSINEVLSRTLITSLTTLVAVGAILAFGGMVLFDFSLALFIGVFIGTYSSVFVATPLVFLWRGRIR